MGVSFSKSDIPEIHDRTVVYTPGETAEDSKMAGGSAWTHVIPGEHEYDGVWYSALYPTPILDRVKTFDYKDDDVILATYPKTGTTWMTKIMKIMNNIEVGSAQENCFRYIEMDVSHVNGVQPFIDTISSTRSPRIYKTHLMVDFFRRPLAEKKTKFVVVMRNPKDTFVSYYHFYRANPSLGNFNGSFAEFMDMVKANRVRNWFDWTQGWWEYKDHPNVMFFKYENMKADLVTEIRRLAKFLGIPPKDDVIEDICEKSSFASMRDEIANNPLPSFALDPKICPFMRKGVVGDWRNYFTNDMNNYVDDLYSQKIVKNGLEFQFD